MKRVHAKHLPYFDTGHLGEVVADMAAQGAPTIRVCEFSDGYFATEGSHRLAAAHHLGLEPRLVVEVPDATAGLDDFWERVATTLPTYDFDHVHVLNLKDF